MSKTHEDLTREMEHMIALHPKCVWSVVMGEAVTQIRVLAHALTQVRDGGAPAEFELLARAALMFDASTTVVGDEPTKSQLVEEFAAEHNIPVVRIPLAAVTESEDEGDVL